MNNIRLIAKKEVLHIVRDKLSVTILFLLPAAILFIFGTVLSSEVKEVHIAVFNEQHEPLAELLLTNIDASESFHIVKRLNRREEIVEVFAEKNIKLVIVVPKGFTQSLTEGRAPEIELYSDASDTKLMMASTSIIRRTIESFIETNISIIGPEQILQVAKESTSIGGVASRQEPKVRMLYNPELRKETTSVPGLIMIIFILISSIMLSANIVKEKEQGSNRMMALTPFSTFDIILGKSLPYFAISVFHIISVWIVSHYIFKIDIAGSRVLFFSINLLFAINSMSFGLLIASLLDRQLEVAIACWLFLFIPNVFMSGFLLPLSTMPDLFKLISWLLPGTSFIEAYRNIVFKAVGIKGNLLSLILLSTQTVVILMISRQGLNKMTGE